jgi:hypothetical protein
VLLDVASQSFAQAVCDCQVHGASTRKMGEYKRGEVVGSKGDDAEEVGKVYAPIPRYTGNCREAYENNRVKCDLCVGQRL